MAAIRGNRGTDRDLSRRLTLWTTYASLGPGEILLTIQTTPIELSSLKRCHSSLRPRGAKLGSLLRRRSIALESTCKRVLLHGRIRVFRPPVPLQPKQA